jgi:hypothetical protein
MKWLFAIVSAVVVCAGCNREPAAPAAQDAPAAQRAPAGTASTQGDVRIALSGVNSLRAGLNPVEATVTTSGGMPITDAEVEVELVMPPSGSMAEMRNRQPLQHESGGRYRGDLNVMMTGGWNATVTVKRGGTELGRQTVALVAQ